MLKLPRPCRLLSAALSALVLLALPVQAERITVFAAASLGTVLDMVADAFAAATGHAVTLSYAGSSALARQIEAGAPADLLLSANAAWMDRLEAEELLLAESRIDLLGNRLVLIAHGPGAAPVEITEEFDLDGLLGGGRLAMALVEAVPAGIYGKAALQSLGVWDKVSGRVAQSDNVRTALALVALGEAPLGIVYATDAAADPRVSVIGRFPEDSHPAIVYPAALIAGRNSAAAARFLDFLQAPEARAAFEAAGFRVLAE